jgi:hypothetical protein
MTGNWKQWAVAAAIAVAFAAVMWAIDNPLL